MPRLSKATPKECSQDLGRARETIRAVFAKGLDDEAGTSAYVGVSQEMMNELLAKGRIDLSPRRTALRFHQTDLEPYKTAELKAAADAKRLSTLDLIRTRLMAQNKWLTPEAGHYVSQVLTLLEAVRPRVRNRESYSVSFDELLAAVQKAEIPVAEKRLASLSTGDESYQTEMAYLKMRAFTTALRCGVEGLDRANSLSRARVVGLFSSLPMNAGYVLATRGPIDPSTLLAENLSGLEPLGQEEFSLMENLEKR